MTVFPARSRHALPARVAPAGARSRRGSPRLLAVAGRTLAGAGTATFQPAVRSSLSAPLRRPSSSSTSQARLAARAVPARRGQRSPTRSPVRAERPRRPTPPRSISQPRLPTGRRCSCRAASPAVSGSRRRLVRARARPRPKGAPPALPGIGPVTTELSLSLEDSERSSGRVPRIISPVPTAPVIRPGGAQTRVKLGIVGDYLKRFAAAEPQRARPNLHRRLRVVEQGHRSANGAEVRRIVGALLPRRAAVYRGAPSREGRATRRRATRGDR